MKLSFRLAAFVAGSLVLLAAATHTAIAAPVQPPKTFVHLELQEAMAQAAQLRAEAKAARQSLGAEAGPEDRTPPVLTALSLNVQHVNVRTRGEQVVASWTLTDDLSGARAIYLQLSGPHGQISTISETIDYTDTSWSDKAPFVLDEEAAPGIWTVDKAMVYDMHGNVEQYNAADLAALGNNEVKVNNKTYDVRAPAIVSGEILTPEVRLSKRRPGIPHSFGDDLKMRLTAIDKTSGPIVSGVRYTYASFCLWEGGSCQSTVDVVRKYSGVRGDPGGTYKLGRHLVPGNATGTYTLYYLEAADNAGNLVWYRDVNHGGSTDFSTMFPGGTTFEVLP